MVISNEKSGAGIAMSANSFESFILLYITDLVYLYIINSYKIHQL